jgi:glycosyltransferase involved in cell wall biosynthesis
MIAKPSDQPKPKKILVITQVVDESDPVLGFFTRWIEELSYKYESVEVICLQEGKHALPLNVKIHSLGKESCAKLPHYIYRFYAYLWNLRNSYDVVFVHMNQEYILLAGPLWKVLGKKIYLWRNHYAGNFLTNTAAFFCTKVFCTSRYSYTAKYKKTVLMPVGIDIKNFFEHKDINRIPRSLLFLGRIAPSKRVDMFIEACALLKEQGISYSATIVGSPLTEDKEYHKELVTLVQNKGLTNEITFLDAVSKAEAALIFSSHTIFVNCSPSGMFDKTLFEAAASGCVIITSSKDFRVLSDQKKPFENPAELAEEILECLELSPEIHKVLQEKMKALSQVQSLKVLVDTLKQEIII